MGKGHRVYSLSFYDIDPDVTWQCQAPRHGPFRGTRPNAPAVALALFALPAELERGRVVVHQASYVCAECRARMEADI